MTSIHSVLKGFDLSIFFYYFQVGWKMENDRRRSSRRNFFRGDFFFKKKKMLSGKDFDWFERFMISWWQKTTLWQFFYPNLWPTADFINRNIHEHFLLTNFIIFNINIWLSITRLLFNLHDSYIMGFVFCLKWFCFFFVFRKCRSKVEFLILIRLCRMSGMRTSFEDLDLWGPFLTFCLIVIQWPLMSVKSRIKSSEIVSLSK